MDYLDGFGAEPDNHDNFWPITIVVGIGILAFVLAKKKDITTDTSGKSKASADNAAAAAATVNNYAETGSGSGIVDVNARTYGVRSY